MDQISIIHLAAALFGGLCQEIAHWHVNRNKITLAKYKKLIRSKSYWIISIAMVLASPIFFFFWVGGDFSNTEIKDSLLFGVSFPLIIKKLAETSHKENVELGDSRNNSSALKGYLGL